ncbi:MAG: hemerythrin domain-containing protein [Streptosporangiales bacterium]|nr:hemerythrin domain-containing protein [Streptosporangiales bacterium]
MSASGDTRHDVVTVLTHDHRAVEHLFAQLEDLPKGDQGRREIADTIVAELARHSVAEEQYLYPAVREHVPGGDELAEHEIEEHAEAERIMHALEGLDPGDPEFDKLISQLMRDIRHHVHGEETDLFPRLTAVCPESELRRLGEQVEAAKKVGPTRPHPDAPDRPPMNKLGGPVLGLADRIRELLSSRR